MYIRLKVLTNPAVRVSPHSQNKTKQKNLCISQTAPLTVFCSLCSVTAATVSHKFVSTVKVAKRVSFQLFVGSPH